MPGHDLNEALMWSALSANIQSEEPIDVVLHESYPGNDTLWDQWEREAFVPFNPTDKYTIATVRNKATGQRKRIMKGAPQVMALPLDVAAWTSCYFSLLCLCAMPFIRWM